jgi:molybdate-binding protein
MKSKCVPSLVDLSKHVTVGVPWNATSLARPTGGARRPKDQGLQRGQECVDAIKGYEVDRTAETAVCNWFP